MLPTGPLTMPPESAVTASAADRVATSPHRRMLLAAVPSSTMAPAGEAAQVSRLAAPAEAAKLTGA